MTSTKAGIFTLSYLTPIQKGLDTPVLIQPSYIVLVLFHLQHAINYSKSLSFLLWSLVINTHLPKLSKPPQPGLAKVKRVAYSQD